MLDRLRAALGWVRRPRRRRGERGFFDQREAARYDAGQLDEQTRRESYGSRGVPSDPTIAVRTSWLRRRRVGSTWCGG
jgi:hypothetical protein